MRPKNSPKSGAKPAAVMRATASSWQKCMVGLYRLRFELLAPTAAAFAALHATISATSARERV
jgi:hypothetical protein